MNSLFEYGSTNKQARVNIQGLCVGVRVPIFEMFENEGVLSIPAHTIITLLQTQAFSRPVFALQLPVCTQTHTHTHIDMHSHTITHRVAVRRESTFDNQKKAE